MSCIGIKCYESKILLFSDGRQGNAETGDVISDKVSKIFKVSSSCAALHMGRYGDVFESMIEQMRTVPGLYPPFQIAQAIGKALQAAMKRENIDALDDFQILVVGYTNDDTPELWRLAQVSERAEGYGIPAGDPFEPQQQIFSPGDVVAQACGLPDIAADFKNRLNFQQPEIAFTEMVRDLKNDGVLVGGDIFTSTVKPPQIEQVSLSEMQQMFDKIQ